MRSSLISLKKKRFFSFFFGFFLVLAPSLEASGRFISTDRPKRKTHTQGPLSFSLSFIHSFILSLSSSLSVWLENVHAPGRWPSVVHLVPNETPRSGSLATFWNIDKKKKAKKKKERRRTNSTKPGGVGLHFGSFFFFLRLGTRRSTVWCVCVFQSASIWFPGTHFGTSKKRNSTKTWWVGASFLVPFFFRLGTHRQCASVPKCLDLAPWNTFWNIKKTKRRKNSTKTWWVGASYFGSALVFGSELIDGVRVFQSVPETRGEMRISEVLVVVAALAAALASASRRRKVPSSSSSSWGRRQPRSKVARSCGGRAGDDLLEHWPTHCSTVLTGVVEAVDRDGAGALTVALRRVLRSSVDLSQWPSWNTTTNNNNSNNTWNSEPSRWPSWNTTTNNNNNNNSNNNTWNSEPGRSRELESNSLERRRSPGATPTPPAPKKLLVLRDLFQSRRLACVPQFRIHVKDVLLFLVRAHAANESLHLVAPPLRITLRNLLLVHASPKGFTSFFFCFSFCFVLFFFRFLLLVFSSFSDVFFVATFGAWWRPKLLGFFYLKKRFFFTGFRG